MYKFVALPVGKGGNYADGFWQIEPDNGQDLNGGFRFLKSKGLENIKALLKLAKEGYKKDQDQAWKNVRTLGLALSSTRQDRITKATNMKFVADNQLPIFTKER